MQGSLRNQYKKIIFIIYNIVFYIDAFNRAIGNPFQIIY